MKSALPQRPYHRWNADTTAHPVTKHEFYKQDLIHQHMMAHYRRLYSAKCAIDTSKPLYFKPRYKPKSRPSLPAPAVCLPTLLTKRDLQFLESLAGDVKSLWNESDSRSYMHHDERLSFENSLGTGLSTEMIKSHECIPHGQSLLPCEAQGVSTVMLKSAPSEASSNIELEEAAKSKKNTVLPLYYCITSKLRELSVYHPPRRRVPTRSSSAHSTPCSRHHKCCVACGAFGNMPASSLFEKKISSVIEHQREELMYLQFVQDITDEILSRDIYSNEDMNEVFDKHMSVNSGKLQMAKMKQEIHVLKKKLGMPEDSSTVHKQRKDSSTWVDGNLEHDEDMQKDFEQEHDHKGKGDEKADDRSTLHIKKNVKVSKKDTLKTSRKSPQNKRIQMHSKSVSLKKKKDKDNVLGLLQNMGFDSNMAEEICLCIADRDLTKYSFPYDEKIKSCLSACNFSSQIDNDGDTRGDNEPKCIANPSVFDDAEILLEQCGAGGRGIYMESDEEKETHQDPSNGSGSSEYYDDSLKEHSIVKGKLTKENAFNTGNKSDKESNEALSPENSRSCSTVSITSVVASPDASDYSSMKDHDESVSEAYSNREEPDEGRESASEVEEEILEDLSQATSGSDILQLAKQLKKCNINVTTSIDPLSVDRNKVMLEENARS